MTLEENASIMINNGLLSQFISSWKMLREAINNVSEEYWHKTNNNWSFSRSVYHIIETQEFYIRNDPDGMVWGKLLADVNNKNLSTEEKYLSKATLQDYLVEIQIKVSEYLKNLTNEDLLKKDGFKWFSTIFVKLLYLLRHTAHHLGELSQMLREWDCERMKWQ